MDWYAVLMAFVPTITYLLSIEALRAESGLSLCTPFDGPSCFFTPPNVPSFRPSEYLRNLTADTPNDHLERIPLSETPAMPSTRSGYTVSMPDSWVLAGCEENEYPSTLEEIREIPGHNYKDTHPMCGPPRRDPSFSEMLDDASDSLENRVKSVLPSFPVSYTFIVSLFMTTLGSLLSCWQLFRSNNSARKEVSSLLRLLSEQENMMNKIAQKASNSGSLQHDDSTRETYFGGLGGDVAIRNTYLGALEEKDENLGVLEEEANTYDARYQKLLFTSNEASQDNGRKIEDLSAQNTYLEQVRDQERRQRESETKALVMQLESEKAQKGNFHKALLAAQIDIGNLRSEKVSLTESHEVEALSLKGKLSDIRATMDERRVAETTSLRNQLSSAQEAHEQTESELGQKLEDALRADEDSSKLIRGAKSKIRTLEGSLRGVQEVSEDLTQKVDRIRNIKNKLEEELNLLRPTHERAKEELASRQEELDVALAKVSNLESNQRAVSEANNTKVQALERQLQRRGNDIEENQKAARSEEYALKIKLESAAIKHRRDLQSLTIRHTEDQQKLHQNLKAEFQKANDTQLTKQAEAHHEELRVAKASATSQEQAAQSKVQAYEEEFNRRVGIHEAELASIKAIAEEEFASLKKIAAEKEAELRSEVESMLELVSSESADNEENKKLLARLKEANAKLEGVEKHLRDNVRISRNGLLDQLHPGRKQRAAASRPLEGATAETALVIDEAVSTKPESSKPASPGPAPAAPIKSVAPKTPPPKTIGMASKDSASPRISSSTSGGAFTAKPADETKRKPNPATVSTGQTSTLPTAEAASKEPEKDISAVAPTSAIAAASVPLASDIADIKAQEDVGEALQSAFSQMGVSEEKSARDVKAQSAAKSVSSTSSSAPSKSKAGPTEKHTTKVQATPAPSVASGPAHQIATSGKDKPAPTVGSSSVSGAPITGLDSKSEATPAPAAVFAPARLKVPTIQVTTPDQKAKSLPAQTSSSSPSRSTGPPAPFAGNQKATPGPATGFAPASLFVPKVPTTTSQVPAAPSIPKPPTTSYEAPYDVQMSDTDVAKVEEDEGMADAEGITDDEMDADSLFDEPLDPKLIAELLGEDIPMNEAAVEEFHQRLCQPSMQSTDTQMGEAGRDPGQEAAAAHAEELPDAPSAPPNVSHTSATTAPDAPQPKPIFDLSQFPKAAHEPESTPQMQRPQINIDFATIPSKNKLPAPQTPPQRRYGTAPSENPLPAPPPLYNPHNRAAQTSSKNVVTGSTPSGSHTSVIGTTTRMAKDWDEEAIEGFIASGMSRENAEERQRFATGK